MRATPSWLCYRQRLRAPAGVFMGLLGIVALVLAEGYRINLSPSEPLGLWRVVPVRPSVQSLRRGDDVGFCAPVRPYPFLEPGICRNGLMPFVKQIVGLPGDRIVETDGGVTINGHWLPHSRPRQRSVRGGVRLPQWRGRVTLAPGRYWTYGGNDPALSFDSRYWGPLERARIRFIAHPVFTWETARSWL